MGRKGDLLRAAKKNVTYTFTQEQLAERDRAVIAEWRERSRQITKKEVHDYAQQEYAEKESEFQQKARAYYKSLEDEFYSEDDNENFQNFMTYLLCLSCRVLIEQFGWKPIRPSRTTRTEKFAKALLEELYKIEGDSSACIQDYSEETYKLYGIKFTREEQKTDGNQKTA